MIELGKREDCFGMDTLKDLDPQVKARCFEGFGSGAPVAFPTLTGDNALICGYDQGLGERMIVCESLEDMQQLYSAYASGAALKIRWYIGNDPGFITVLGGEPEPEHETTT